MEFHFKDGEAVASGIKRIAQECVDEALNQFEDSNINRDEAIHEARKVCKRLRAVVRLVRNDNNEEWYDKENKRFRDASRLLAPARDAAVLVETLDTLLESSCAEESAASPEVDDVSFQPLRTYLVDRHQRIRDNIVEHSDAVEQFVAEMRQVRQQVAHWPIAENDFDTLAGGLKRVYKRGIEAMESAYSEPSAEAFHEWRKQVKYLWHQAEILEPIWPDIMVPFANAIHNISDYLGNDHDYAEFLKHTTVDEQIGLEEAQKRFLVHIVTHRRHKYQSEARAAGEKVYAEKPKRFVGRLGSYWHAWRAEAAAA